MCAFLARPITAPVIARPKTTTISERAEYNITEEVLIQLLLALPLTYADPKAPPSLILYSLIYIF